MDIKSLYIGASVMYNHLPYRITNISKDKLGLIQDNYTESFYSTTKGDIKFVKTSLIKPIPISEIIVHDNRFVPGTLKIEGQDIEGLSYKATNNDFAMFICKDSKFIDVYRLFINKNDYGKRFYTQDENAVPVLICYPISYIHELVRILRDIRYSISFKLL